MDVVWCPHDPTNFITLSNELRLYRVRQLPPHDTIRTSQIKLDDCNSVAEVLAIHSEVQYAKCISAYHGKLGFPLLALGGANGRVTLTSFKQLGIESPLVGLELAPRHARPCNGVAWNPTEGYCNLLAVGLDRHKSEGSLLVWDVSCKQSADQASQFSAGEGIFSLCWFPKSSHKIAAGAQRFIKVFDYREGTKFSIASQTKAVYGICVDSFNEHRLAAFYENIISIWDSRSFERPLASFAEAKNVLRIGWNPTRSGLLGSISKDSSCISLHDVQTSIVTEEPELVVLTRNINCGLDGGGAWGVGGHASFAWHPIDENRLLTVSADGSIHDSVVFERMPTLLSSDFGIAWTTGKEVKYGLMQKWTPEQTPSVDLDQLRSDISFKMHQRVKQGYGLNNNHPKGLFLYNASLVTDDEKLSDLWVRLRELTMQTSMAIVPLKPEKSSRTRHSPLPSHPNHHPRQAPSILNGVKAVLFSVIEQEGTLLQRSSIDMMSCKGVDSRSRWKVFRSKGRQRALRLCGWDPDRETRVFEKLIVDLVISCQFARAAAIAIFSLHLKLAVEILLIADQVVSAGLEAVMIDFALMAPSLRQMGQLKEMVKLSDTNKYDNLGDSYKFCIMALSGYTDRSGQSSLWRDSCSAFSPRLADPYLRAIFAFLTASDDEHMLNIADYQPEGTVGMKLADRIAFACIFIPDNMLVEFIDRMTRSLVDVGDLDGLLLTGLSSEGVTLLQNFVDSTGDIQTAILTVYGAGSGSPACFDERVVSWCDSYRSLLDQWALWSERAEFDVQRHLLDITENVVKEQVHLICNFCSKSVTRSPTLGKGSRSGGVGGSHSSTALAVSGRAITSCSNCRKPLPRCALCQVNIGTAIPHAVPTFDLALDSKTDNCDLRSWFTWCQSCRHGGHADHVAQWFTTHKECPVTQCNCHCALLDAGFGKIGGGCVAFGS